MRTYIHGQVSNKGQSKLFISMYVCMYLGFSFQSVLPLFHLIHLLTYYNIFIFLRMYILVVPTLH